MNREENLEDRAGYGIGDCLRQMGSQYRILGSPDRRFLKPYNIWEADEGTITFASRKRIKNIIETINESKASVIITDLDIDPSKLDTENRTIVLVQRPREVFIDILNRFLVEEKPTGIVHPTAIIHPEANIHDSVSIGANCVVGDCSIGERTVLHPNVIVNEGVKIGKHVIINPSTVIGYDGFGYSRKENNSLEKFPHFGGVVIEDNVEIGSNVSIDRGTLSNTIIRKGSKVDNFSHIAHNVDIGMNCQVIAHSMIGGSTTIGDNSHIAPAGILRDCVKIGKNVTVGLGAVVTKDVPDNMVVIGNPAEPIEVFLKKKKKITDLIDD